MEMFGITMTVWNCLMAWFAIATTYLLYDWLKIFAWRRKYNVKGAFPLPVIGTFYQIFGKASLGGLDRYALKTYGKVYTGSVGGLTSIFIADIDLLKKIFIKEHVQFQNRFSIDGLDTWPMDKGLLALKDSHWKRVRSTVTPTFSPGKIKLMTKEINFCADLLVKSFLEKTEGQQSVDTRHHMGCYTMDVIAGTGFGIRTYAYSNPDEPFVYHASKVFGNPFLTNPLLLFALFFPNVSVLLNKYLGVSFFYPKKSIKFFTDTINRIMEERIETHQTDRADMIGLLMTARENEESDSQHTNKRLSRDEVMAMGFLAFVAGYDTTASLLSFFAYAMATHPDIQEELIAEIDAKYTGDDVDVRYEDISEMPYLDQVVSETLRMYPPILRMNRMTSHNKDVEVDGHLFPRNTNLQYSIWQFHHDLGYYEEPDKFKPERFTPEEKQKRDPFTFMPFGHGPRNCIGMRLALLEAKIAVIHVLKKLKFARCPETEEPLELHKETFLRPKRPIKLGVEIRKKE